MSKITNLNDFLSKLEAIVNIDSGTVNTQGVTKVALTLQSFYKEDGFYTEIVDLGPSVGNGLFVTNCKDADSYDVLLVGHMDTVFKEGEALKRPFKVVGNKAFGPGVFDMKDGDLIILWALSKLDPEQLKKVKIAICFNPDEETGSTKSSAWIDEIAKKSRYALICEGQSELGAFTSQRKGISHIDIKLKGRGAHAGACPEKGRSAINAMANCIQRINALANENVTVNFGVIQGGLIANAIAEDCFARIDVRFWTSKQCDEFFAKFKKEFETPFGQDIKANYDVLLINPAMEEFEKTEELKQKIAAVAKKLSIKTTFVRSGAVSDGNHISQTKTPVLDGFGGIGGDAHTESEWLDLDTVETKANLLKEFFVSLI
ncbi:MAG: M20 family metallopeptidase [Succinivibrio sp.]|nr:M20 family metallopeptidase [Succinivibrio sp.]